MKKILIIVVLISILLLSNIAFGADALYRLLHNNQDALVIAEIVEVNDNSVKFRVEKSIMGKNHLNESSKIKQLDLDEFIISKNDLTYIRLYNDITEHSDFLKVGDAYLVSLNKVNNKFEIAWGIYKLSSLDYETLDVLYAENISQGLIMEAIAVKHFINSDGQENEFSFDGRNNILKSGDTILYDGDPIEIEDTKDISTTTSTAEQTLDLVKNNIFVRELLSYAAGIIIIILLLVWLMRHRRR